jgi:hypothetical protein
MKVLTTLIVAMSVGLSLAATAEPFNNRGTHFIDEAPQGSPAPQMASTVLDSRFNDRGTDFITEMSHRGSAGASTQPIVRVPNRFNKRDSVFASMASGNEALGGDVYTVNSRY